MAKGYTGINYQPLVQAAGLTAFLNSQAEEREKKLAAALQAQATAEGTRRWEAEQAQQTGQFGQTMAFNEQARRDDAIASYMQTYGVLYPKYLAASDEQRAQEFAQEWDAIGGQVAKEHGIGHMPFTGWSKKPPTPPTIDEQRQSLAVIDELRKAGLTDAASEEMMRRMAPDLVPPRQYERATATMPIAGPAASVMGKMFPGAVGPVVSEALAGNLPQDVTATGNFGAPLPMFGPATTPAISTMDRMMLFNMKESLESTINRKAITVEDSSNEQAQLAQINQTLYEAVYGTPSIPTAPTTPTVTLPPVGKKPGQLVNGSGLVRPKDSPLPAFIDPRTGKPIPQSALTSKEALGEARSARGETRDEERLRLAKEDAARATKAAAALKERQAHEYRLWLKSNPPLRQGAPDAETYKSLNIHYGFATWVPYPVAAAVLKSIGRSKKRGGKDKDGKITPNDAGFAYIEQINDQYKPKNRVVPTGKTPVYEPKIQGSLNTLAADKTKTGAQVATALRQSLMTTYKLPKAQADAETIRLMNAYFWGNAGRPAGAKVGASTSVRRNRYSLSLFESHPSSTGK